MGPATISSLKAAYSGACENKQCCFRITVFGHSSSVQQCLLIHPKSYPMLPERPELRQIALGHMLTIPQLRFMAGCRPTKHFNCYLSFWCIALQPASELVKQGKPIPLVKDK